MEKDVNRISWEKLQLCAGLRPTRRTELWVRTMDDFGSDGEKRNGEEVERGRLGRTWKWSLPFHVHQVTALRHCVESSALSADQDKYPSARSTLILIRKPLNL